LPVESFLLASLGGAFGLVVAWWSIQGLARLAPESGIFSFTLDFDVDGRVLLFTFSVSLLSAALAGLAPALRATRSDLTPSLRDSTGAAEAGGSRLPARSALVLAQVSMSMILLIGAGLFLKSFSRARGVEPGFVAEELLTANLRLDLLRYTKAQGQSFYREIVERVEALPSVRAASLARIVPLAGGARTTTLGLPDSARAPLGAVEPPLVQTNLVGPNYFETMGIALLQGRDFAEGDIESSPGVVIVNENFVSRYFPSEDVLGKRIRLGRADSPWREIIGVARDSKYRTLGEEPAPHVYQPLGQQQETGVVLLARTKVDPRLVLGEVRSILLSMEPRLPIVDLGPLTTLVASSLFPARMGARLLTAFATLALALAALGLYGVTSYGVSRRKREMGIRVALGAHTGHLIRLVVGEGLILVGAGVLLGGLGAAGASRLVRSFLYRVSPTDPAVFALIALLLTLVMLIATYLPARRAARSDPLAALRYE
jgi:predicted permease